MIHTNMICTHAPHVHAQDMHSMFMHMHSMFMHMMHSMFMHMHSMFMHMGMCTCTHETAYCSPPAQLRVCARPGAPNRRDNCTS